MRFCKDGFYCVYLSDQACSLGEDKCPYVKPWGHRRYIKDCQEAVIEDYSFRIFKAITEKEL